MGALAEAKQEWKLFRDDRPGERFGNHRVRMKQKSRAHSIAAVATGVVLVNGGVVMLFTPGPGAVAILFGLALIGSHSSRLSALLDRGEPWARQVAHRTKRKWRTMSGQARVGVLVGLALVGVALLMAMWRFVISAYLLG